MPTMLDNDELYQYSLSRRHGKRVRRGRKSPQETTPLSSTREPGLIPPQPPTAGAECTITPYSIDLFAWDDMDPTSTATEAIPAFPYEHELELFVNGTSSDILMWSNFESPDYVPQRDSNSSLNVQASLVEREPSIRDVTMSTDTASGQSIEYPRHETEHALECEARALTVLRSLQYSPTLCSPIREGSFSAATSNASVNASLQEFAYSVDSMDTLLATNKAALNELAQMLECGCAEKSHVALLYFTILSKVVFWYNVAVTTRYNSERVELKPMKIQFSVLDFDDEDNATLHRAVLSSELQKAGTAIRAFEFRFKELPWGRLTIRAIREELERSIHEV
jgi:hypothetical protein